MASPVLSSALASLISSVLSARFLKLPSRIPLLGFLFVSFRPSLIRSHSRSTSACLLPVPCVPFLSAFPLPIRPLSLASLPVLTTQPLRFLSLLPDSAPQWLPQCAALAFAPSALPVLSRLVSRAFLPGFGTQLRCSFPFALPCFAPTAVPQVLTFSSGLFHFRSTRFRLLLFRFQLLSLLFFLSALPQFRLTSASLLAASALASAVSPFLPAWSPMRSLPVLVLGSAARFLSSFPASLPQPFHR